DVELLAMADQLLKELGIEGVTLHLNTLGDGTSREAWRGALIEYFSAVKGDLSEDSQERLEKNPLRILDSKDSRDKPFLADAPKIDDYLSEEARTFFQSVTDGLDAAGVKWVRAESLVRGLDYYRHTAFEFIPEEGSAAADALGAQSTVLGGGRYDGLMESLGGPATPAVGWAAGIERLAMLVGEKGEAAPFLAVIPDEKEDTELANQIAALLRQEGIGTEVAYSGKIKKRFEQAAKSRAKARLVIRRQKSDTGLPDRVGHHIVVNQPDSVRQADERIKEVILTILEQVFDVVRHDRPEAGYWVDAVLQERT
ncbi:MAG: hypothetical protein AAGL68_05205, partial [Pseudomonadota bacterium]